MSPKQLCVVSKPFLYILLTLMKLILYLIWKFP